MNEGLCYFNSKSGIVANAQPTNGSGLPRKAEISLIPLQESDIGRRVRQSANVVESGFVNGPGWPRGFLRARVKGELLKVVGSWHGHLLTSLVYGLYVVVIFYSMVGDRV